MADEDLWKAARSGDVARAIELAAEATEWDRGRALREAAEANQLEVVKALAAAGATLDDALSSAVGAGAVETARWVMNERPDDIRAEGLFSSACTSAPPALLEELLERGARIDDRSSGWTGLMNAAREKHAPVLELLLSKKADPRGLALAAAEGGDVELLQRALSLGDELSFVDDSGTTPLMGAAQKGHLHVVRFLADQLLAGASEAAPADTKKSKTKSRGSKASKAPKGPLDATDSEGRTALAHAAGEGHIEVVEYLAGRGARLEEAMANVASHAHAKSPATLAITKLLLDRGAGVNARSYYGHTALQDAAAGGWEELCSLLLERGAKVDVEDISGHTALALAARWGHTEVVRRLLDAGASMGAKPDSYRDLPLDEALGNGHMETARLLVERGALDARTRTPPLNKAARSGKPELVALLLDHGADINAQEDSYDKTTALRAAAEAGHTEVVRLLLDRGAVDAAEEDDEYTPMQRAAQNGHLETVALLAARGLGDARGKGLAAAAAERGDVAGLTRALEIDPDPDAPGKWERLPLHLAAKGGHLEAARLLLDRGADPNRLDKDGASAHRTALDAGHKAIAKLLEERGARLDLVDLVELARKGDEAGVRALLERPVNVDVKVELARTALHEASELGHEGIARLLVERGAALDAADEDGWTPLMEAAEMGHLGVVTLLLERGASPFLKERQGFTAYELAKDAEHGAVMRCFESRSADEDPVVALERAIDADDAERVALLAARGRDLAAPLSGGEPPLHEAARKGKVAALAKLLELGCNVDQRGYDGRTPLYVAAEQGQLDAVKALLSAKASPAITHDDSGTLVLGRAIWNGDVEIVRAMLDAGFSPDVMQGDDTALEMALGSDRKDIARLLLERSAAVDGAAGAKALTAALSCEAEDLVAILLERGARLDTSDYTGRRTALQFADEGRPVTLLDPNDALRRAADEGHMKLLALALAQGGSPNAASDGDDPALLVALKGDHWELAEVLLRAGADPNVSDYEGTLAMRAAKEGKLDRLKRLVAAGASLRGCLLALAQADGEPEGKLGDTFALCLAHGDDVNAADDEGHTALFHAAAKKRTAMARALLEVGAAVDAATTQGITPLMEAAGAGSLELARALVERGADVHAKDKEGTTPIQRAARAGAEELVSFFADRGVSTAGCLSEAAKSGKIALVKRFLGVCDLEEKDADNRWTPAMNAANAKHKKALELLLDRGAKVELCALAAAWGGAKPTLEIALARGADVNAADWAGRTPLMMAADAGAADCVALLLAKGAAVDAKDEDGLTALMYAVKDTNEKICMLLLEAGANRGTRSNEGKAAIDYLYASYRYPKLARKLEV